MSTRWTFWSESGGRPTVGDLLDGVAELGLPAVARRPTVAGTPRADARLADADEPLLGNHVELRHEDPLVPGWLDVEVTTFVEAHEDEYRAVHLDGKPPLSGLEVRAVLTPHPDSEAWSELAPCVLGVLEGFFPGGVATDDAGDEPFFASEARDFEPPVEWPRGPKPKGGLLKRLFG